MADERSPLLQNRRVDDCEIDYSAVNEVDHADSVANQGSTDAEQQQTEVAPQNSVITLVRLDDFHDYLFVLTLLLTKVIPMAIGIFLSATDQTIIVACV